MKSILTPVYLIWFLSFFSYYILPPDFLYYGLLAQLFVLLSGLFVKNWRLFCLTGVSILIMSQADDLSLLIKKQDPCVQLSEPLIAKLVNRLETPKGLRLHLINIKGWCNSNELERLQGSILLENQKLIESSMYLPIGGEIKIKNSEIKGKSRYQIELTGTKKTKIYNQDNWKSKLEKSGSWVKMHTKAGYYLDQPQSGFFKALLLADRKSLTKEWKEIIGEQGVFHLFAISGLHVGLLYLWMRVLLRGVLLLPFRAFQSYTGWLIVDVLSMIAIYFFLDWIGMPLTALRAWIMLAAWMVSQYFFKFIPTWIVLLVVGTWMLITDPTMVGQISFLLSFASVLAILMIVPLLPRSSLKQKLAVRGGIYLLNLLMISLWIELVTFPFMLIYFQKMNWLGFLVNPFHILFTGLIYLPSSLLVFVMNAILNVFGVMWWQYEIYLYSWVHFLGKWWSILLLKGHAWIESGLIIMDESLSWNVSFLFWGILFLIFTLMRRKFQV